MSGVIQLETALESCHCRAEMHLTQDTEMIYAEADILYTLTNNLSDGDTKGFSLSNGVLTKTSEGTQYFNFSGCATIQPQNIVGGTILNTLYELHVDDLLQDGCQTPASFDKNSFNVNFSCAQSVPISKGQEVKVKSSADIAGANVVMKAFSITLWGR